MTEQTRPDAVYLATVIDAYHDPARRDAVLRSATCSDRPRPGTVRQAAEMFNPPVHPRTIERYARRGLLHPIRITARMIRYDLREVEALATRGAGAGA